MKEVHGIYILIEKTDWYHGLFQNISYSEFEIEKLH